MAPRLLVRTDHYTEGVVVAPDGTVFFSMTSVSTVMRMRADGSACAVWAHVPAANGHAIDVDGSHLVMSSAGSVQRLDGSGTTIDVLATQVDGRWLTYPNDVALDTSRGTCYVTDSGYKKTPATVPPDPQGRVYRFDRDDTVREVAAGIAYANGIALAREGASLYVGESVTGTIWSYPLADDGSLGERRLFARTPRTPGTVTVPDGFTVASDGRLFVAHYGACEILVYAPDGALIDRLAAGNRATSHAAFSPDERTLYVSGGIEDESGPGAIFAIAV
ncbi:MAG TPA: SMP-30/gluconolactonase/LRE family protein [Candidatus Sulfotelmatobacter sp.]|nr:SMP-30/gluconolactonase/LRE family protein [Candidatus Sulfotelmatobacter sp.]